MSEASAVDARVLRAIARAAQQVNQTRPPAQHLGTSPETVVLGAGGVLDSLGLVNFIVAVEDEVSEEFGMSVSLADDRMRSRPDEPLKSIGSLAAYIASQVQGTNHGA